MNQTPNYEQVRRVYNGEHLDAIRERLRKRYERRHMWFKIKWAIRDFGYYAGTLIAAAICAVAYIGAIAILCGY